ncbi:MAG: hypothetical protein MJ252_24720 [archaeon]|nr:hypothetical protein [archaeon]
MSLHEDSDFGEDPQNKEKKEDIPKDNIEKDTARSFNSQLSKSEKERIEAEYLAKIEELEAEIVIEKGLTNKMLNDPYILKEIDGLKKDLSYRNEKLEQLINTNGKQRQAIERLREEMKNQFQTKKKEESNLAEKRKEEESVKLSLKLKDKDLDKILAEVKALKLENEKLKNAIDANGEYHSRVELQDNGKYQDGKIKKLEDEKHSMEEKLKEHKKCMDILDKLDEDKNNATQELRKAREEMNAKKKELKDIEFNIQKDKPYEDTKIIVPKKKSISVLNSKNGLNGAQNSQSTQENKPKEHKKQTVSEIVSNQTFDFIPEGFLEKLEIVVNGNKKEGEEEDSFSVIKGKLEELKNLRILTTEDYTGEIAGLKNETNKLKEKLYNVQEKEKKMESKSKKLEYKLNQLKNNKMLSQKQLSDLQRQIDYLQVLIQEKDQQTKVAIKQLNDLRKTVRNGVLKPINNQEVEGNEEL